MSLKFGKFEEMEQRIRGLATRIDRYENSGSSSVTMLVKEKHVKEKKEEIRKRARW